MRLLECGSGCDLRFTGDFTDNIPVYAILSYVWGADADEVPFTNIHTGFGKRKAVYTKLSHHDKEE